MIILFLTRSKSNLVYKNYYFLRKFIKRKNLKWKQIYWTKNLNRHNFELNYDQNKLTKLANIQSYNLYRNMKKKSFFEK